VKAWISNEQGLSMLGEVPAGVTVEVYPVSAAAVDADPPSDPAGVEFWVPPFLGGQAVVPVAASLPDLRVVQLMTAGAETWIGRLPEGVTLCDGRGIHDSSTSEWVLTAILAYLREFPRFARQQAERRWGRMMTDELAGKRVLIVGAGSIGEAIAARLTPFEVTITLVARTARSGVHGVDELPELLPEVDIVVLIVPMTAETAGMVDAKFLAAMRDGALLVNAARGPVVDTAALVAEAGSGRIGAALDVTDPEPLPVESPLWTMENVLLTPHVGGSVHGFLARAYRLAGAQLRRYSAGESLDNVVTGSY
jgi:phosphoglycerate dehydrogenase-like enzyme